MSSTELGRINSISMPDITNIDHAPSQSTALDQITKAAFSEAPYLSSDSSPLEVIMRQEVVDQYNAMSDIKDADYLNFHGEDNIYVSIGTVRGIPFKAFHETWQVGRMRQTAGEIYELMPPVNLIGGDVIRPCAPAMMKDNFGDKERALMVLHQDCFISGDAIQAFESYNGQDFSYIGNLLEGEPGIGKYDPEISEIGGRRILTYVRYDEAQPNKTEIHAAELFLDENGNYRSVEIGPVVRQEDLEAIHNQTDEEDFEWGMEAAKMHEVIFPDGSKKIVTTLVTFQKAIDSQGNRRERETRQRFTFAVSSSIGEKPYWVGYLAMPQGLGENGHGVWDGKKQAIYQERQKGGGWGLRVAKIDPQRLYEASSASMGLAA